MTRDGANSSADMLGDVISRAVGHVAYRRENGEALGGYLQPVVTQYFCGRRRHRTGRYCKVWNVSRIRVSLNTRRLECGDMSQQLGNNSRSRGSDVWGGLLHSGRMPLVTAMVWFLIAVGVVHAVVMAAVGGGWEGPLSARKPLLFGLSTGVTCWSLVWIAGCIEAKRWERRLVHLMAGVLVLEVGLITLQHWRGRASHFNTGGAFDGTVEGMMLALIVVFVVGLAWLCVRVARLTELEPTMAIACRWGVWLLMVSCLLGGMTTLVGKANLQEGRAAEIYGEAGVLKYPHGVVLHAVQVLPILGWILLRKGVGHSQWMMRAAVAGHGFLLIYALRQTFMGRGRLDLDLLGGVTLGIAVVLIAVGPMACLWRPIGGIRKRVDSTVGP